MIQTIQIDLARQQHNQNAQQQNEAHIYKQYAQKNTNPNYLRSQFTDVVFDSTNNHVNPVDYVVGLKRKKNSTTHFLLEGYLESHIPKAHIATSIG